MKVIDTLKASRTLKKNGFDDNQADAIIEIVSAQEQDLATKGDVTLLRKDIDVLHTDMDAGIAVLRTGTDASIAVLCTGMDASIAVLRSDTDANIAVLRGEGRSRDKQIDLLHKQIGLTQWMVGMCVAGIIAILVVLVTTR